MNTPKMIRVPADLPEVCRLCLQFSEERIPIFEDHLPHHQSTEVSLSSKIMTCVSIKISPSDRGPREICSMCVDKINLCYQFNEDCKAADAYLQNYLNEVMDQSALLSKVDDVASSNCESTPFEEITSSSFDSVLDKSVTLKSDLPLLLDVYLNGETPLLDDEPDKMTNPSAMNIATATNDASVVETNNETLAPELEDEDELEPDPSSQEPPRKRKGYNCELCNNTFVRFVNLLNHDDTVHQEVFRAVSCPECGRLFISEDRLRLHQRSHREKTHKCGTCDKLFSSAKSLQVHSRLHNGKYRCTACGYRSTSKLYLEQHSLKHVGNETVYVCELCSVSFTSRSSLLRHESIHLKHEGKIYKCSICNVVTRRRCDLQDHMASHGSETTKNEYKCDLCPKSYGSRKTLRNHIVRHKEGQFICKICDKKLHSESELRQHAETHTHAKQYHCFHCDRQFSFRSTLNKHLRSKVPRVRSDIPML